MIVNPFTGSYAIKFLVWENEKWFERLFSCGELKRFRKSNVSYDFVSNTLLVYFQSSIGVSIFNEVNIPMDFIQFFISGDFITLEEKLIFSPLPSKIGIRNSPILTTPSYSPIYLSIIQCLKS